MGFMSGNNEKWATLAFRAAIQEEPAAAVAASSLPLTFAPVVLLRVEPALEVVVHLLELLAAALPLGQAAVALVSNTAPRLDP